MTGIVLNNASLSVPVSTRPGQYNINTPYSIDLAGLKLPEGPHILRVDVFRDSAAQDKAFDMTWHMRIVNDPCIENIVKPPSTPTIFV